MLRLRQYLALPLALLAVLLFSGCATTVALKPAPDANNPLCASVIVTLPKVIEDQDRRWTDAQATGAWGDPASIILTCGVTVPAPTAELPCVTLGGADWLVDDSEVPLLRMTTYGRDPAVQVFVDTGVLSSNAVLNALGPKVAIIPATGACTSPAELDQQ